MLKQQMTKIPNLQLIPGLFVLDPDFSLRLGVNKERKAGGFGDNDAILSRQVIIGEPLQDGKTNDWFRLIVDVN